MIFKESLQNAYIVFDIVHCWLLIMTVSTVSVMSPHRTCYLGRLFIQHSDLSVRLFIVIHFLFSRYSCLYSMVFCWHSIIDCGFYRDVIALLLIYFRRPSATVHLRLWATLATPATTSAEGLSSAGLPPEWGHLVSTPPPCACDTRPGRTSCAPLLGTAGLG